MPVDERVRVWRAENPKGKRGTHEYHLEEYGLDRGTVRVAEKVEGAWVVHPWVKQAILLYFSLRGPQYQLKEGADADEMWREMQEMLDQQGEGKGGAGGAMGLRVSLWRGDP